MKIGRVSFPGTSAPASRPRQGRASPGRAFVEILREGAAPPRGFVPSPTPRAAVAPAPRPAPASAPAPAAPSPLARGVSRALAGASAGEARLDALLEAAARGKTFKPAELLAMQVTVFRYSQTVEVLSRATDRLVGAVKQTLGTQV
jgi:hypothetical protein